MNLGELTEEFTKLGLPAYRARQVFKWLHKLNVNSFSLMSDLPAILRKNLEENYNITSLSIEKKLKSEYDSTIKYLFRLNDGEFIESVLMEYLHGYSICISTQVGCRMGCTFCATGLGGLSRNLSPAEMLAQVQTAAEDTGHRISNIVLMGMGEPLDNFDNVLRFLELVSCEEGLNIGMRHISLSTCGLVDKIEELIPKSPQFTLSVSLHAPNDALRLQTMPINRKWNVDTLLKTCRRYAKSTGRRISFEYAMIKGFNDSDQCAHELGRKLKGMLCHVNLIPVNTVKNSGYNKSTAERQRQFCSVLKGYGITATIRRTLGSDINASCGQLRGSLN
ncbi:MAG: 23S rRNA (adenine(2503)-C(2))-methyltransferase RlmN [Oscillospiraceae bacterium]|jgi:23S rRNA (adenine2503-C2)-methyltransferase|nr:23S rRNA (adenine(2503)-C(2))-methyltransferase RlmN [Oscillospiraceae bacterium]